MIVGLESLLKMGRTNAKNQVVLGSNTDSTFSSSKLRWAFPSFVVNLNKKMQRVHYAVHKEYSVGDKYVFTLPSTGASWRFPSNTNQSMLHHKTTNFQICTQRVKLHWAAKLVAFSGLCRFHPFILPSPKIWVIGGEEISLERPPSPLPYCLHLM